MVVFDFKSYEQKYFDEAIAHFNESGDVKVRLEAKYYPLKLNEDTLYLANGAKIVCIFVNDTASSSVLTQLSEIGVKMLALRCAGFNQVDLKAASALNISVARVPAYSPYAVAEHCVALLQTLNRKTHLAYNRVKSGNFSLSNLVGVDIHGRTIGVLGTGKIGYCFIQIMLGFGCKVLAYDVYRNKELEQTSNVRYVDTVDELLSNSSIISIHCPLTPETRHMINKEAIEKMPKGVIIVNTSRGALINTPDLIWGLKSGHIGGAGLDVYEYESDYFFEDKSAEVISDDTLARLLTFGNVLVTSHQAFLTEEALRAIANVTVGNVHEFLVGGKSMKSLTNTVNL
ncbi:hypothetical protein BJ742DRAFT_674475 [Cladochytrium replicatum]|nr:hypothetical protein BJ742DRAFT_674475 [Cladochytrium replicatum]